MRHDRYSRSAGLAASSSRTIDSHRPGASRRGDIADTGQSLPTIARSAPTKPPAKPADGRMTQAQREAAARRAARRGMPSAETLLAQADAGADSAAAMVGGKTPHFYGPFANYANSPLPTVKGGVIQVGNSLTARKFATDYATPPGDFGRVFVTVPAQMPNGLLKAFKTFNQASPGDSPPTAEGGVPGPARARRRRAPARRRAPLAGGGPAADRRRRDGRDHGARR